MSSDADKQKEASLERDLIERDKKLSHAVELVDVDTLDEDMAGMLIEDAMTDLNRRALSAGMVILTTTITATAYTVKERGHMVYVIAAQWMEREALERLQRQQHIIGGPNGGGPRRMG